MRNDWGGTTTTTPITRYPLRIPQVVSPSGLALNAKPTTVDLGGGKISNALGYNGLVPGPTIRAKKGDTAHMTVTNSLTESTTTHWHGLVVPTAADGHPQQAFGPGVSQTYDFPIIQRASTNWYHPHAHMMTGRQSYKGLAGAFIITDDEELALGLPSGAYEIPLVLKDVSVDSAGNLTFTEDHDGFLGDIPMVNGTRDPKLDVDTALYRFRIVNGSTARIWHLALSNGAPITVIGNDGGLLEAPVSVTTQIDFGPGERLDILIDFRAMAVGSSVTLQSGSAGWDSGWGGSRNSGTSDILQFNVARQVSVPASIPSRLSTIPKLVRPVGMTTRRFKFDGRDTHNINGYVYDMNRVDFRVPFGTTELWEFQWGQGATHPVHVHGTSFQVQSRSGGRGTVSPWEQGWKDTVLVGSRETVQVLVRFDNYRSLYLLHCHNLEHEDTGMMMNFEVF
jgi:FtsP/CotA-like multicopper oxidase with cupredoxin domain